MFTFNYNFSMDGIDVLLLYAFAFILILAETTHVAIYFLFVTLLGVFITATTTSDSLRTLGIAFTAYTTYRMITPVVSRKGK